MTEAIRTITRQSRYPGGGPGNLQGDGTDADDEQRGGSRGGGAGPRVGAFCGGTGVGARRLPDERRAGVPAHGSAKVSCATARAVAVAVGYEAKLMASQSFPGSRTAVHGFRCVTNQVGHESEETFSVRCSGGRGTVGFEWGV